MEEGKEKEVRERTFSLMPPTGVTVRVGACYWSALESSERHAPKEHDREESKGSPRPRSVISPVMATPCS